jgi:hypothetical protein
MQNLSEQLLSDIIWQTEVILLSEFLFGILYVHSKATRHETNRIYLSRLKEKMSLILTVFYMTALRLADNYNSI